LEALYQSPTIPERPGKYYPLSVRVPRQSAGYLAMRVLVSAVAVVSLRRRAIEADLQDHAVARQRSECQEPPPQEQHAVGEHRCSGGSGRRSQDFSNIREDGTAHSGYEDFAHTECARFAGDALDARKSDRPPWRGGR